MGKKKATKKKAKRCKPDFSQTALAAVEKIIGGKLAVPKDQSGRSE
jgi:hypothetical protein